MKKIIASAVLAIASTGAFAEEVNTQPVAQQPVAAQAGAGTEFLRDGKTWVVVSVTVVAGVMFYEIMKKDDETGDTTTTVSTL